MPETPQKKPPTLTFTSTPKALFNVYDSDSGAWLSSFYGDDPEAGHYPYPEGVHFGWGSKKMTQEEEDRMMVAWGKAMDKAERMHSPLAVVVKIHRHEPLKPRTAFKEIPFMPLPANMDAVIKPPVEGKP